MASIHITVPDHLLAAFRAAVEQDDLTVSRQLRVYMREYVARHTPRTLTAADFDFRPTAPAAKPVAAPLPVKPKFVPGPSTEADIQAILDS